MNAYKLLRHIIILPNQGRITYGKTKKKEETRKREACTAECKGSTLNMYEHQSTYSPNLPVRFLIYLAQEYQMVIERADKSLYGSGRITLPTPQCVVFYNGTLEEYSRLVAVTRHYMAVEKDVQTALNKAVDYCIEKGILKEFLLKNRAEVLGMLLEEFDAEKYERTIREEGLIEGEIEVNRLGILLTKAGRSNDFLNSLSDREHQKKLFIEFGLEEEKK